MERGKILLQVFSMQKITDMLSSNHGLSLYTKLITVLKKRRLAKHEIKAISHHSRHQFITQYISLRCTTVNEFYRMIRMGVAGHIRGNQTETDEYNEYANS